MKFNLPEDYRPYTDKYFLRARKIIESEGYNPMVKSQIFIRKGNCRVYGINEAISILKKYCTVNKIYALSEGSKIANGEVVMIIEARIQEIIDLETIILGVISAETTIQFDKIDIDVGKIAYNMRKIVDLIAPRPVSYFGARHWRYDRDKEITHACFTGGAKNCSTDIGASNNKEEGIGTIPHALEAIYHHKYGLDRAVKESTMAFDIFIDEKVPRVALIDYANREVTDTIETARLLKANGRKLDSIRIDTCGENYMQGVKPLVTGLPYFNTKGVSILGVKLVREALNSRGFEDTKIILSSGFGNPEKVKAFLEMEKIYKMKLFDGLGVGGVFYSRMATMDIVDVDGDCIHKVGRTEKIHDRLMEVV